MKKMNWTILGLIATIAGAGISVVASIVDDKKTEEMIEEKIDEALAKRSEES